MVASRFDRHLISVKGGSFSVLIRNVPATNYSSRIVVLLGWAVVNFVGVQEMTAEREESSCLPCAPKRPTVAVVIRIRQQLLTTTTTATALGYKMGRKRKKNPENIKKTVVRTVGWNSRNLKIARGSLDRNRLHEMKMAVCSTLDYARSSHRRCYSLHSHTHTMRII